MIRRIAALLLIATSGWLLYQTAIGKLGGIDYLLSDRMVHQLGDMSFVLPMAGGLLGLMGGLIIFLGGPGGAAIAMIGGVVVAGFAVSLKEQFHLLRFWENELAVGASILALAGITAVIGRN